MTSTHPTFLPEVEMILDVLIPDVQSILGDQFIGFYLYGSLAYGGFDRDSDVDFIVVTKDDLSSGCFTSLQRMHARIAQLDSWCATQLEGSYTPLHALQAYDPVRVLYNHIDRGRDEYLQRMQVMEPRLSRAWWSGWIFLRAVLWQSGISLAGPPPRSFITPESTEELKQASIITLDDWIKPMLDDLGELAHPGYQPYLVLTLCRLLYTLDQGAITSKQAAASWAQQRVEQRWRLLIDRAWIGRHHPEDLVPAEEIEATRDFIRFVLEKSQPHRIQNR
jgi:hypothetical protein